MPAASTALLDTPDAVRLALSPVRRQLLTRLRQPASATELATEMRLGRQRVNYHLRALENAGLLSLAETRQKRGCVERILVASARAFVVDPDLVGAAPQQTSVARQDRFAAEHLVSASSRVVRDVTRMQAKAEERGQRLLTFTIETDVTLAAPVDLERFSSALAEAVALTVARFNTASRGRRYRVVIGAHPTPHAGRAHA